MKVHGYGRENVAKVVRMTLSEGYVNVKSISSSGLRCVTAG